MEDSAFTVKVGRKFPKRQTRPTQEAINGLKTPKTLKPTRARPQKRVENTKNVKTNPRKAAKVGRKYPKR
jgi:hypothetical protein